MARMRGQRFFVGAVFCAASLLATAAPAVAQTGRVVGTVKDDQGNGIRGATVRAENPDAFPGTLTATTDAKGRFTMIGLRSGVWTFEGAAPGFAPLRGTARVVAFGQTPPLDFTLTKAAPLPPTAFAAMSPKELLEALRAADALVSSGQYDAALATYQGIAVKVPALTTVKLQIARTLRLNKKYLAAIGAAEELLAADDSNVPARLELARVHLDQGDSAAALAAAERALALDPSSSEARSLVDRLQR